jgi:putative addiction module antidote
MSVVTEALVSSLKLRAIGNSIGVILPKELLACLSLSEGDTIYAVDMPDGIRLTRTNPLFEKQMESARRIMKRRRAVLRELAK